MEAAESAGWIYNALAEGKRSQFETSTAVREPEWLRTPRHQPIRVNNRSGMVLQGVGAGDAWLQAPPPKVLWVPPPKPDKGAKARGRRKAAGEKKKKAKAGKGTTLNKKKR